MNQDEIKNNILAPDQWVRILFMAGYALAAWAVLAVLLLTLIIQLIMVLIQGRANRNLQKTSFAWAAYLQQIIHYLTYVSNDKPFPFKDFPGSEGLQDIAPETAEPPEDKPSAADTSAAQQDAATAPASQPSAESADRPPVYDDVPSFSSDGQSAQTGEQNTTADSGENQPGGHSSDPDNNGNNDVEKDLPPR